MRFFALLLCLCLLMGLCACGNRTGGAYTKIATLAEGTYGIGFRNEDPAADYVKQYEDIPEDGVIARSGKRNR